MISINGEKISTISFSDGDERVDISGCRIDSDIDLICWKVDDCSVEIMRLLKVVNAIKQYPVVKSVKLLVPYFPAARADRVFNKGVSLNAKVFADLINSCCFDRVYIADPHSDVVPALINNVEVLPQHKCIERYMVAKHLTLEGLTLCAPDIGASKKLFQSLKYFNKHDYIQAVKIRDTSTGDIVKCDVVEGDPKGKDILIVDDIADGGASFIHLAKMLKQRGAKTVSLYVTHGIFQKGLKILSSILDNIYVYGIVGTHINEKDLYNFNNKEENKE